VHPDPQRQGQATLLALGGVGPRFAPFEYQDQVVAMGADGVHATPEVVVAVLGQRVEELARPTPLIVLGDHDLFGNARQAPVRRPYELLEGGGEALTRRDQDLSFVGQTLIPYIERARHIGADAAPGLA
jgi:hypothetical protein